MSPADTITFMIVLLILVAIIQLVILITELLVGRKVDEAIYMYERIKKELNKKEAVKKPKVIPYGQSSNYK